MEFSSAEAAAAGARDAAGQLLVEINDLTDDDARGPSLLPGWSRAHVLSHVEGISLAVARQLEYAARGEQIDLYDGGYEGRTARIDSGALRSAEELREAVKTATTGALAAVDALGPDGWDRPVRFRGGTAADAVNGLWRELVIHGADLGLGLSSLDWSRDFCLHLFDFLSARIPSQLRLVLQPLGEPPVTIGGGPSEIVVTGLLQDIAAWLAGRPPLGGVSAAADGHSVELPELLPWPSGMPAA